MNKKILCFILSIILSTNTALGTIITRPNTYTAGTVIDPVAVTANETTVYNDYNGNIDNTNIKTNGVVFGNLSTAIQVLWSYRKPVLVYNSGTVVNIETGTNGTSGQVQVIFPDGNLRTDSTAGRIQCPLTQNAVLSGSAQGGLRTGAVVNNTWYAIYAVKQTDNANNIIAVADVVPPIQSNFSTLNTNFGTNGWIYLGMIRYGDASNIPNVILSFSQAGNVTLFSNSVSGASAYNATGIHFANTASAASLTYTYVAGMGTTQVPNNITFVDYGLASGNLASESIGDSAGLYGVALNNNGGGIINSWLPSAKGVKITPNMSGAMDVWLVGFIDGALGVGANPLL